MENEKMMETWEDILEKESEMPYFQELQKFLEAEYQHKKIIYPQKSEIFSAFTLTPLDAVKVVILGQDPYHQENQAHGLAFSVPLSQKNIPRSLQNIFKEISPTHLALREKNGNLEKWAKQGVFLLNTTLTVEHGKPKSHSGKGWEIFTDHIISHLSKTHKNLIFVLWGKDAQQKISLIDAQKHSLLTAPHPSPLSAHRGFLGCNHFVLINDILRKNNKTPISWE